MAIFRERKPGEIHTLTYYFIFPNGDQKIVGQMKLVEPLPLAMPKFKFLIGRPECARDLVHKGECSFKDHNGVRHLIQIRLDPETKY
jgi:hypothetical protein